MLFWEVQGNVPGPNEKLHHQCANCVQESSAIWETRIERSADCRSAKAQRNYAGLRMFTCLECAGARNSGVVRDHWVHNPKGQRSRNATEFVLARRSSTSSVASAQPVARGKLRNRHRNFPEEDFSVPTSDPLRRRYVCECAERRGRTAAFRTEVATIKLSCPSCFDYRK